MGVNAFTMLWFEGLLACGAIKPGASILDLGPQDTPDGLPPGGWYRTLGFGRYASIDLHDPRATYRLDLNEPIAWDGSFATVGNVVQRVERGWDVIYNGGTLEHVFNVGQAFKTVHELLAVGGVALHVAPTQGERDHGFYNFQPCFFRDLADANGYAVVDLTYLADVDAASGLPPGQRGERRDHLYVALRKTSADAFVIPQQRT